MAKNLTGTLSNVRAVIGSLMAYRASLLPKMELVAERLYNEYGIPTVNNLYTAADGDSKKPYQTYFQISQSGNKVIGTLFLEGEEVAFVEFGAGIHYNSPAGTSPHPKGVQLGYTIGSYGYGQGQYDSWEYKGDDGELHTSLGTEATMPLLNANQEMRDALVKICKEVFA